MSKTASTEETMVTDSGKIVVDWMSDRAAVAQMVRDYGNVSHIREEHVDVYQSRKENRSPVIKVATTERGEPVACLWYAVVGDVCEIDFVYVRPEWRRKGIASFMLQSLVGPASLMKKNVFTALVPVELVPAANLFAKRLKFSFHPDGPLLQDETRSGDSRERYRFRYVRPAREQTRQRHLVRG